MTSPAADLAGSPTSTAVTRPATLLAVGRVAALAALVLCVLLQAIDHDFFPPQISVSQYGIGPNGWIFTAWTVLTAIAVLTLHAGEPANGHHFGYWLVIGSIGLVTMGVVRTDAGGLQQSWHAKVHMVGSIVALVALPIGMAMAMTWARARWRRTAWILVLVSAGALIMVLLSATGSATWGMDSPHSWAFWQSVAVTVDMVLLSTFALATFSRPRDPDPGPRALV
ncbi:hypothetical protein ABIB25_000598 [Nakamurella sp. UYEF19]|uniref:DUF998 domain-containing protein n=1 Tax=Nakamurella sp. UYEF19 TaxID=1756392 RepID=UPI0033935D99